MQTLNFEQVPRGTQHLSESFWKKGGEPRDSRDIYYIGYRNWKRILGVLAWDSAGLVLLNTKYFSVMVSDASSSQLVTALRKATAMVYQEDRQSQMHTLTCATAPNQWQSITSTIVHNHIVDFYPDATGRG